MSGRATLPRRSCATLAEPALPVGAQVVARAYLAACVQFRPHPEIYLREGHATLALIEESDDIAFPDILRMSDGPMITAVALASIGRAHFYLGDPELSLEWLARALATEGGAYGPYRIHLLGSLALAEAWQGRLIRAAELSDEALELARELALLAHPAPADAYIARALVAIQRGEAEAGAFALHEGHLRAASNGRTQLMWIAHAASMLVDPDGTDAATLPPAGSPPPIARMALRAIAHRQVRHAGGHSPAGDDIQWSGLVFEDIAGLLTSHDVLAARAEVAAASDGRRSGAAEAVERRIVDAWLAHEEGHQAHSRKQLLAALEIAEPEGLVYPFLAAGPCIEGLLRVLPGKPGGFRKVVLDRFAPAARPEPGQLIEQLTSRELELLAYLPSRLTNAELAARCFVSVNTVKTHMAHIYRKLDAGGRDAAIARARELGLLDGADIARVG